MSALRGGHGIWMNISVGMKDPSLGGLGIDISLKD